ncbi:MAG: response regulator [Bacteroidota bacterium]
MKATRIWLLDDDWISNLIHEVMIGHFQPTWEVEAFTQPCDFISLYRKLAQLTPERLPDVLFLDLNMPRLNGWEVLDQLTDMERVCPILVLTSSIGKEDLDRSKQYPLVQGFISKPLCMRYLVRFFEKRQWRSSIHSHLISPSQ